MTDKEIMDITVDLCKHFVGRRQEYVNHLAVENAVPEFIFNTYKRICDAVNGELAAVADPSFGGFGLYSEDQEQCQ